MTTQRTFTAEEEQEMFLFLDSLRESGVTNMYGAGPYLVEMYELTRKESHAVLGRWMETYSERHPRQEEPTP